ncbi:transposase [Clostridium sartagoforme AAU1]|uniref:Transposase n=1 Tax=Clostridium sartagoforme AAU1 TaxID=1202534 RepID=R9CGE5_9CLOT|nr:transposase [Clostridium sartagoforme AAU1]
MGNDIESLSHTKWRCQYHIVFAPKYRRQIIYGKYKAEIGKILRTICIRHGVEIIEANACRDHILVLCQYFGHKKSNFFMLHFLLIIHIDLESCN